MSSNPFADAESWDVSTGQFLGVGNFVVTIDSVDREASSNNGNPKLVIELSNSQGEKRDYVPYSSSFLRRVVSVFDAAEIERPQDGEFDPDDNMRLTEKCAQRLVGKRVGVIIREEPNQEGKLYKNVQGYVTPDKIDTDVPIASVTTTGAPGDDDQDLPF